MVVLDSVTFARHGETVFLKAVDDVPDPDYTVYYDVGNGAKADALAALRGLTPAALWAYTAPPTDDPKDVIIRSVQCVAQPDQGIYPWRAVGTRPTGMTQNLQVTYMSGTQAIDYTLVLTSPAQALDLWEFHSTLSAAGFTETDLSLWFRYGAKADAGEGWSLQSNSGKVCAMFAFPLKGQTTEP